MSGRTATSAAAPRLRRIVQYALLAAPALLLAALVALVAVGAWITSILREPARFDSAPRVIQTLTRSVYWHTRTHWQTVRECAIFDHELLYRPRPGQCRFRNAEFDTTMNFDGRGVRVTPEPAPTSDGIVRPRLVLIGDSHTMGWGVEDHETFASLLASEFGYRTVNLGVSSYAAPRELRRLQRDFELQPADVIVIQYAENDELENRAFVARRRVGPYEPAELEAMQTYRPTPVRALPVAGVLLTQLSSRLLGRTRYDITVQRRDDGAEDPVDATAAFLGVLESFQELMQHEIYVVETVRPGQRQRLSAQALNAHGYRLVVPAIPNEQFFRIDDHMRPAGHRTVAGAIAEAVAARSR